MRPKKIKSKKTILLEYLITFALCAIIVVIWISASRIFSSYEDWLKVWHGYEESVHSNAQKNYFVLTNAFFGTGVICLGFGLLVIASNGGAFEMIVYGVRRFISIFQKEPNKIKYKTYFDYHAAKSAEPRRSFLFLIINGLVYLAASGVFLILYLNAA